MSSEHWEHWVDLPGRRARTEIHDAGERTRLLDNVRREHVLLYLLVALSGAGVLARATLLFISWGTNDTGTWLWFG